MGKAGVEELRKNLIEKAKRRVRDKYSEGESHVVRAMALLQDLDPCFNLLAEHCIEWYSAHFPELSGIVKDNQVLLKLVYFLGKRENFMASKVNKIKELVGENAEKIVEAAGKSIGGSIEESAMREIQLLALNALNLKEERGFLVKFIESEVSAIAKNLSAVAGPLLAARLLSEAGSLRKLALMPSSTIQLLGAEKSLFRHIQNRQAKPPKHGLIYAHPLLQKTPKEKRGKMARALAGKLSIAAKADYFGGKDVSEKLKRALEKRFKELAQKKQFG